MFDSRMLRPAVAALALMIVGCATERELQPPVVVVEPVSVLAAGDVSLRAMLAFYRKSRGMSPAELQRERAALQGRTTEAMAAMRLAILLGQERSDLARALGLLDGIARMDGAQASALQPLARLLSDQYAERLKLETQADRLGALARDAERRAGQLQQKIDALADIERSLPGRPAPPLPDAEGAR